MIVAVKKTDRIAVIPGYCCCKVVAPEGGRALEAAARKHGFDLNLDWFDFACVAYYEKHGRMMPPDWKAEIGGHDAVFFCAVGLPPQGPDHRSLLGPPVTCPPRLLPDVHLP